jgi:DinB superfamily
MMNEVGRVADKADVLRMLQEGMDSLSEALHGIDASLASLRPNSGTWSVVECVEHLTLTERALLLRLKEAKVCDESHEDRPREAKFQDLALNRARRIEAPDPVRPRNGSTTLAEAVEEFKAARRETIAFVDDFPGDLRWRVAQHPLITRPVNCYEMLILMAMHPRRHALQIAETRGALESGETRGS